MRRLPRRPPAHDWDCPLQSVRDCPTVETRRRRSELCVHEVLVWGGREKSAESDGQPKHETHNSRRALHETQTRHSSKTISRSNCNCLHGISSHGKMARRHVSLHLITLSKECLEEAMKVIAEQNNYDALDNTTNDMDCRTRHCNGDRVRHDN